MLEDWNQLLPELRKAGATLPEVGEALGVAIVLNAGSTYVYSLRVLEAFEQMG